MDTPPLPLLNAIEARVLGSLIEKKELTPDVYPLTLNAAQAAANQKTAREPVMALEPSHIHRALKTLQEKGSSGRWPARGSSATRSSCRAASR